MARRSALIVDKSRPFVSRLRRILRAIGYTCTSLTGQRALLDYLRLEEPGIILLTVDLPNKRGFSLFNDIKRVAKQVPVILLTSTVSREEMRLHESLQIHANAYLDKRALSDEGIIGALNNILHLEMDEDEVHRLSSAASSAALSGGGGGGRSRDGARLDGEGEGGEAKAEPCDILEDGDLEFTMCHDEDQSRDDAPVLGLAELEEERLHLSHEVERLTHELEMARGAVRSSPFSAEYARIKARVDRAEKESAPLRAELATRARQIRELKTKIAGAEGELRTMKDNYLSERDKVCTLDEQLAEEVQRRIAREHEHASELESLRSMLLRESAVAVKTAAAKGEQGLAVLRREYAAAQEEQSARHREESGKAIEIKDAEWRMKMKEAAAQREGEFKRLIQTHGQELDTLAADNAKKLCAMERECGDALQRSALSHEEELAAIAKDWDERLRQVKAQSESERDEDCEALNIRYRKELKDLRAQHVKERERLQHAYTEGLERLSSNFRGGGPKEGESGSDHRPAGTPAFPSGGEEKHVCLGDSGSPAVTVPSITGQSRSEVNEEFEVKNPLLRRKLEEKRKEREHALADEAEVEAMERE